MNPRLFLVRYAGEVTTKGRGTRLQFLRRLQLNVEEGLRRTGLPFRVTREWSRMLVEAPAASALSVLPQVFGIASFSPVERRPWTVLDDVVAAGDELHRAAVAGRRFAVRARRGGERSRIPFRSGDVERALGARLLPASAGVDLGNPEVTVQVEVRGGEAFFFVEREEGPGGLPLGTEGRALALVSGGFDSAVAAWQMLRRGVRLDYLFCDLAGEEHRRGVLRVMKLVAERWSHGSRPRLHAVDLRPAVAALQEHCEPRYWQVLLKRLMLQVADRVARQLRIEALVTGEAVGQVSSQTLRNLHVISSATDRLLLRPLVGANKEEILELARRLGTYELSARVPEYCALQPKRPATHARAAVVAAEEARLPAALVAAAVAGRQVVDLAALTPADLGEGGLGIDEWPPGARLVDLRARAGYDAWHPAGAEHLDYFEALAAVDRLPGDRPWVFYCEVGLKSADLAERLRHRGLAAWHVEGGLREVMGRSEDDALAAALSPAWMG